MLSEKVRGKQRAHETSSSGTVDLDTTSPTRNVVVRFAEGLPDLIVSVSKSDPVGLIKRKIREARPELKDRRLRLIHSGRLLTDRTFLYDWLSSLEERQQRTTTKEKGGSTEAAAGVSPRTAATWIHCAVGPRVLYGAENEESEIQVAQMQPVRGFDRLGSLGFSEADIVNFRRQFHSQSSSNYLDIDFETEEEYDEHARALEEQWIDSIDDASTAALSQSSPSNSALLQGVLIGFFLPILPFFLMRNQKPPVFWNDGTEQEPTENVIFSKRTQMGLVVGFLVNAILGIWRFFLDSS